MDPYWFSGGGNTGEQLLKCSQYLQKILGNYHSKGQGQPRQQQQGSTFSTWTSSPHSVNSQGISVDCVGNSPYSDNLDLDSVVNE
jgi:hypothetical protein